MCHMFERLLWCVSYILKYVQRLWQSKASQWNNKVVYQFFWLVLKNIALKVWYELKDLVWFRQPPQTRLHMYVLLLVSGMVCIFAFTIYKNNTNIFSCLCNIVFLFCFHQCQLKQKVAVWVLFFYWSQCMPKGRSEEHVGDDLQESAVASSSSLLLCWLQLHLMFFKTLERNERFDQSRCCGHWRLNMLCKCILSSRLNDNDVLCVKLSND